MSSPDKERRPDPDALLALAGGGRGKLTVFLGAAPGVGKTYAMLGEAHRRLERGTDVVAAVVPKVNDASALDVQALFALCRNKLGATSVPSLIQVLSQIPKTASEKPQDRFLMEALQLQPQSVHAESR